MLNVLTKKDGILKSINKTNILVYTTVFCKPCVLYEPLLALPQIDLICYTNMEFQGQSVFQMLNIDLNHTIPLKRHKHVKIWWPDIFDNYEYSLYIDSTVQLKTDPSQFINFLKPESDILLFLHPGRNCLYDEARTCLDLHLNDPNDTLRQTKKYLSNNFPPHFGLWACGIMFRRHTDKMREFAQMWWSEVEHFCVRDQISFPYVAWKLKTSISTFPVGNLNKNPYIHWYGHGKQATNFIHPKPLAKP